MPNFATLVQALGAAFCAILCALSGMGGGGMMIGARTAAWAKAGGGVPTARDYVQDGLIAMWDGIENAGWGVHDPDATEWKDLSDNGYDVMLVGSTFGDNCMILPSQSNVDGAVGSKSIPHNDNGNYFEFVYEPNNKESYLSVVFSGGEYNGKIDNGIVVVKNNYGFTETIAHASYNWTRRSLINSLTNRRHRASMSYDFLDVDGNGSTANDSGTGYTLGTDSLVFRPSNLTHTPGFEMKLFALRIYDHVLDETRRAANYAIDNIRFNLT